ncbi:MAG: hypothetical protein ACYS0I_06460 [Planctomycetota bacterium]
MKRDTKKLLIQVILVLLFSFVVHTLLPSTGANMGEIFVRFIKRHLLICMVGLIVSDIVIFKMRRPSFIAAIVALVAVFVGSIVGSILGALFAVLIDLLIGIYPLRLDVIGLFIVSIISMVFSYNFVYRWMRL